MKAFTKHTGIAVPFLRPNIDTDLIIPLNRRARSAEMSQGEIIFESIRYQSDGSENPDFILNQLPFRQATILLAGENFGTGSSRESAVTGLMAFGFAVVIAPSFGGIFYNNCFGNGLMPVIMSAEQISLLAEQVQRNPLQLITVDLETNSVSHPNLETITFTLDERLRNKMLMGLEDLDEILLHMNKTTAYQTLDKASRPWIYDWE